MAKTADCDPAEALVVWALVVLVAAAVFETYMRLPAAQLYHVSGSGLEGGLSRSLVLLNFPFALVAIALAGVTASARVNRASTLIAVLAVALAVTVAWPGVVDQADLDAKPINAVPAAGVAVALALSVASALRLRVPLSRRLAFDALRLVLALALIAVSLPWLFAEIGFSISRFPLLGRVFLGDQVRSIGGGETLEVVHLGHHHGADGLYLALAALLLSRALPRLRQYRDAVSAYLALMLSYGTANATQDFWLEQVVKRGWTSHAVPSLLHPAISLGWAVIVAVAVAIELGWFRRERRLAVEGGSASAARAR
jgi:hypothetical protein